MGTEWGRQWKLPGGGGHAPGIEMYLGHRFFTITAEQLDSCPAELLPAPLATLHWLIEEAGPAITGTAKRKPGKKAPAGETDPADVAERIELAAAQHPNLAKRWGGDWIGLADSSRSGMAMALGAALKAAGFNFADMCAALAQHADTADWTATKGAEFNGCELRRIFDNADPPHPCPAVDITLASANLLPAPPLLLRDVFPDCWADWIERAAEIKGAPPDYIALALLSTAGGLIGNARWVSPWDGWREPAALWVALIGNPSANKSPAIDPFVTAMSAIEAAENADTAQRRREHETLKAVAAETRKAWETNIAQAVKGGNPPPEKPAGADEPPAPTRRRIFSTDPTVAKAERLSAANPRGLILQRDELAGWIAGMDRFANGAGSDRAFWLQTFGGRPWTPDRVKDGDAEISVPHLTWTILGGIQPDRLASLLMGGDDDGLAARFLYCWPSARPALKRPVPGPGLARGDTWLARLRSLPWAPPEPVCLPLDDAAQTTFQEWRARLPEMEEGAAGLFLSWLGKLPGYALRLALIFSHLAWCATDGAAPPGVVTETDMLRAVTFLADYAVPMAQRTFGEAALPTAERDARTLARWLLRQRPMPTSLNAKALRRMRAGPGIPDGPRMDAALAELEGLGWVRRAEPNRAGQGGRSRKDWIVNPNLCGGSDAVA